MNSFRNLSGIFIWDQSSSEISVQSIKVLCAKDAISFHFATFKRIARIHDQMKTFPFKFT